MKKVYFYFALLGLLVAGCTTTAKLEHRADKVLAVTPIVDTHIDFPWLLVETKKWFTPGFEAISLNSPDGNFDYPRAKKGGLYGPFMSIYVPVDYQNEKGRAHQVADSLIDLVDAIVKKYPDKFAKVSHASEVETNFKKGIISLPMGMENGAPIENLADVAYFHQRGIRYVTLAHSRDNKISDSSYDTKNTNGGLSPYGEQVVKEMNRIGIMVDVSHLTDAAIEDVLRVAQKPLIATHSGCRHFTPGYQRNLPDSLIIAIAKTGGVVQVPFSHYFLSKEGRQAYLDIDKEMKDKKIDPKTPAGRAWLDAALLKTGVSAKTVADHIDHIVKIAGIDHAGIGSDFDGVDYALPPDLADVSMYRNLLVELFRRGYSKEEVQKICSGNVLRVWKANE